MGWRRDNTRQLGDHHAISSTARSAHEFNGESEAEGGGPVAQVPQHSGLGHDPIWIGEDLPDQSRLLSRR